MERKYGIPYMEASFYGSTETTKALRAMAHLLQDRTGRDEPSLTSVVEDLIKNEEKRVKNRLRPYKHLRGKKAVLYTGGVKSWSFISALRDLGIEIVAIGTKKSTAEDEEKMKEILGPDAPLVEDVTPKNLLRLLRERNADILVAGGRNQYLAIKEGYPFVDVNQERHVPYAGYAGLINLAEQISNSIKFYERIKSRNKKVAGNAEASVAPAVRKTKLPHELQINPLKHSPSMGAAIAFQGIDRALPLIHGAQGCSFLGKVLLTKHFREPIALDSSKLFVEDVVLGSEERLEKTITDIMVKNSPALIGVLTSGLSEVKGDDVRSVVKRFESNGPGTRVVYIPTPDYEGGLETGYARALESIIADLRLGARCLVGKQVNILGGSHLTPADYTELRDMTESFGLKAVLLPDLSALDGSREGVSALASGGTSVEELDSMGNSEFTIAIGMSMAHAARFLEQRTGVPYEVFDSVAGLEEADWLLRMLSRISDKPVPPRYARQRKVLEDAMRDAHFYFGNKRICLALEPDLALQTSKWISEMGAVVEMAVIPTLSEAADHIMARDVRIGDLQMISGEFDLLVSNFHGSSTAERLGVPLYEMGFPVYKTMGYPSKVTIGYRGTLTLMNEIANTLIELH
jgi:nitrogenase molybdenum-cofactor synthesis protein NifE